MLSVPEAAARLGVHPGRVRQLVVDGRLAAEKVGGRWLVDVDAVVMDGSLAPAALESLLAQTGQALDSYNWEGLWRPALHAGSIGSDARALGGALLPLHANFAPDRETFLKAA